MDRASALIYTLDNIMAGPLPVFAGPGNQRGYGLGGMLSGLFRTAMPFVKRGAASLAKEVGKEALTTGAGILEDVMTGQNVKRAATRRAKAAGQRLTRKAVGRAKARLQQLGTKKPLRQRKARKTKAAQLSKAELNRYLRQQPSLYAHPRR